MGDVDRALSRFTERLGQLVEELRADLLTVAVAAPAGAITAGGSRASVSLTARQRLTVRAAGITVTGRAPSVFWSSPLAHAVTHDTTPVTHEERTVTHAGTQS